MDQQDSIVSIASDITQKLKAFFQEINKVEWVRGVKHPATPKGVFINVWKQDQQRVNSNARCQVCDFVIEKEEWKRNELVFVCEKGKCLCTEPLRPGVNSHQVCDVCQAIFRSLYVNYSLKDRDYFRKLDL